MAAVERLIALENTLASDHFNVIAPADSHGWITFDSMPKRFMSMKRSLQIHWRPQELVSNAKCELIE